MYICTMKKFIVFIVLLFFVKPIFPVLDFMINYDAIQEICINKDRPELECNGTCHLKTELAKAAQEENPFSAKKTFQLQSEVLFFTNYEWESLVVITPPYSQRVIEYYDAKYSYIPSFDLSKPPLA